MRDFFLVLLMIGVVLWGYRLMGRLDRFLDAHVTNDEGDGK